MKRMGVALIGAGNISDQYLANLGRYPDVDVIRVASRNVARAAEQADKYGVLRAGSIDSALADPDVDLILNLTIPSVHAEITAAALKAGKHVWSEKPLATDRESARSLLGLASQRGLRLGCAPDTVLCPGVQGSLSAIRSVEKQYGEPAFRAQMLFQYHGPDSWHPNPEFLFKPGAGPLMDFGPYYLTDAVLALGPVKRVRGSAGLTPRKTRMISTGLHAGDTFSVEIPTTVMAILEHASGAITDISFSFDAQIRREEVAFHTPHGDCRCHRPGPLWWHSACDGEGGRGLVEQHRRSGLGTWRRSHRYGALHCCW